MKICGPCKYLISIVFLLSLYGCNEIIENKKGVGELRLKLFTKCMELSAKITRNSDDDVSDIVDECGDHAYYIANHIIKTK